jgi:hypothetical protein
VAITKVPGYVGPGVELPGLSIPAAKKAPVISVPSGPPIGYTGSGWNYPAAGAGQSLVHYATTPNTAPSIVAPSSSYASLGSSTVGGAPQLNAPQMPSIDPSQYMGELTSDPLYQTGLASYQSQVGANRSALSNALRQAVIQGGWAPGQGSGQVNLSNVGGQDFSGDIDQATIDAANTNQMSDRAQLQNQLNKGLAFVPYQLAARGAARSGAANVMAANLQNQYDVAANSALQNLSQAIGGNVSTYAQNQANALSNWNAAQGNVANRLAQIATAQAQAAYASALNQNQNQQVNLGNTQISSAPAGPAPKTVTNVAKVKAAVAQAKKVSTAGYGGGGWTYNGVTY